MAPAARRKRRDARQWNEEILRYRRRFEKWYQTSTRIVKRYRGDAADDTRRVFNVLWSNVQVQRPALFSATPTIVAERRHKDSDFTARMASEIIERALNVEMEGNYLKDSVNKAVLDVLLVGRGVVWCQFDAEVTPNQKAEPVLDALGGIGGFNVDGQPVDPSSIAPMDDGTFVIPGGEKDQRVRVDYVNWQDFAHSPEQGWDDVARRGWVARRALMTVPEVVERFGARFKDVRALSSVEDQTHVGAESEDEAEHEKAEIWEIWDMPSRKRIFIAKGDERILEEEDDPYQLSNFFPCPPPTYATLNNDSLIPVPDFIQYEGLADELERIGKRIRGLTKQLRVLGVYRQDAPTIGTLFTGNDDAKMEPVPDGSLTEGDGLRAAMDFVPLGTWREALAGLYVARDQTKQELYEVSGISDILRGSVDPKEKASQSKLKAGYASQRLDQRRQGVEMMVRDCARIVAEMTVELFPPDLLRELSGFDLIPQLEDMEEGQREQLWAACTDLLHDDEMRKYRIDVETGSTVELVSQVAQEEITEYMTSVGNYMATIMPVTQADPEFGPVAADLLLSMSRKFRVGRTVEVELEEYADKLRERAAMFQQQQQAQQQAAEQGLPPEGVPPEQGGQPLPPEQQGYYQ